MWIATSPRILRAVAMTGLAFGGITSAHATTESPPVFDIIPLGVAGGVTEGATTATYIARHGHNRGVMCDAGTMVPGIRAAIARGAFPQASRASDILQQNIAAYLITHPHLDHVAGMIMVSPDDTYKAIYALPQTNDILSKDYFNWRAWPNLTDRGTAPQIGRYRFHDLEAGADPVAVEDTGLTVAALPLSHAGTVSTAFVIRAGDDAVLCLGDTGPDAVEHTDRLENLWRSVAPLAQQGRLRAVIIEASYPDPRPDTTLFGHLTPLRVQHEMQRLAALSGGNDALRGLPVIINHIKPNIDGDPAIAQTIMQQLSSGRTPPVHYILAQQGEALRY